jgi:hypothetical protein
VSHEEAGTQKTCTRDRRRSNHGRSDEEREERRLPGDDGAASHRRPLRASGSKSGERGDSHARGAETPQCRAPHARPTGGTPGSCADRRNPAARAFRDRAPPADEEHTAKRADGLDGVDRDQPAALVPLPDPQRDGVQRVVVEDSTLDHGRPPAAHDLEAVTARQPVGSDRTRLVERPRTQRLERDLVSLLSRVAHQALAR